MLIFELLQPSSRWLISCWLISESNLREMQEHRGKAKLILMASPLKLPQHDHNVGTRLQ